MQSYSPRPYRLCRLSLRATLLRFGLISITTHQSLDSWLFVSTPEANETWAFNSAALFQRREQQLSQELLSVMFSTVCGSTV